MHVLLQSISTFYVCMFMGLVARIDNGMVASSSSVGGSGTLQSICDSKFVDVD